MACGYEPAKLGPNKFVKTGTRSCSGPDWGVVKAGAGSVAGTPGGRGAESGDGGQAECEGADEGDGNTPSTQRSVCRIVGNGRWDADASPMGAPDLEDMVRRQGGGRNARHGFGRTLRTGMGY